MILGTICYKVAHLLLGIISLDRHQHIVHTPSAASLSGETRIFLDFDSPSLIIHQVKMKHIELIASHLRNESLQLFVWNKDTARVHHQLSYMSARLVFQRQLWDGIATQLRCIATKQLVESHQSVEDTRSSLSLDDHVLLLYFQSISLNIGKRWINGKGHRQLCSLLLGISLLEDSVCMFTLISQTFICHNLPVSSHLQRCSLCLHLQVHRCRNQASFRIAYFPSLLHFSKESLPALRLAVSLLAASWHDQFHSTHVHARKGRSSSLWWNTRINLDNQYPFKIGKSKLSYLRCAFDCDVFQRLATGKGCSTHLRYRLGNHHFLQVIAGKESLSTYLLQLIWQDDMLQMMTGMECILRKNRTGCLAQIQVSQLPAEITKLAKI